MSRRRAVAVALLFVVTTPLALTTRAGAQDWEPFVLPPPPGGEVSTPLGAPGDLSFFAPNRGLMVVEGNTSVPQGVYSWDGREWRQLATVCGGDPLSARIAWAGPTEFWTIARPSPGVIHVAGSLCHFRDGAVVGSYAGTNVAGFDHGVTAAACLGAADCWFAGSAAQSADGAQAGGFHLHWDGTSLEPGYSPQGRAVSDLETHGGRVIESVIAAGNRIGGPPILRDPEDVPALLHWIDAGEFSNDPWAPAEVAGVPGDGTVLRALDSDGTTAWAVGGTAGGSIERLPVAARFEDGRWEELPIRGDGVPVDEPFGDVAAIPGTRTAWATLTTFDRVRLAFIDADGEVNVHELTGPGDPQRGGAARIACPAPDDCWLATTRGYLYRWGGPKEYEVNSDPAFQGTITERPNEGASQYLPETPPADDSRLFAPPVERPPDRPARARCPRRPALLSGIRPPRRTLVPGTDREVYRLTVRFRLARRARVALVAERRVRRSAQVVSRSRSRALRAGRHGITVTVRVGSWPTRLRFSVRELTSRRCGGASSGAAGV